MNKSLNQNITVTNSKSQVPSTLKSHPLLLQCIYFATFLAEVEPDLNLSSWGLNQIFEGTGAFISQLEIYLKSGSFLKILFLSRLFIVWLSNETANLVAGPLIFFRKDIQLVIEFKKCSIIFLLNNLKFILLRN